MKPIGSETSGPLKRHDRWLVPYADLMTLLLTLFLALFATNHTKGRRDAAVPEVAKTILLNSEPLSGQNQGLLTSTTFVLRRELNSEVHENKVSIALESRGVVVSVETVGFFSSGSAEVSPAAYHSIAKVATVLRGLPNSICLEGHTDSRPIRNNQYRSNWELSTSRSLAMLHIFESLGVNSKRMSISGYADTQSENPGHRSEVKMDSQRRVDIVILNL